MAIESITNQNLMKLQNRKTVMYELWKNTPISRTELARKTGLNKATITTIINALQEENIVAPSGSLKGNLGRSRDLLSFRDNYGICCGVIFRPQNMLLAVSDVRAKILWSDEVKFDAKDSPLEVIARIGDKLQEGIDACASFSTNLIGIGVGTASLLRPENDLLYAIHSINWHDIPVVDYLRHRFNVPIIADTASNNAMTYEQHLGVAKDVENAIYLTVGYGIGSGLLINGRLFHGAEGFAGDVGHFVIDPSGPQCACGKRGCWEVMASSIAAGRSFAELAELADGGDTDAIATLAQLGRYLGQGIANLMIVLNPELVIIGGRCTKAKKWIEASCKNAIQELVWPIVWDRTRIAFSPTENYTDLLGTLTRVVELLF